MTETGGPIQSSWRRTVVESLLGLQCRATVGVVCLTFAMVALVCWLFLRTTAHLTGKLEREQCAQLSAVLAHAAAGEMDRGDEHALNVLAHQFIGADTFQFVAFFDPQGHVVAIADIKASRLRRLQQQQEMVAPGTVLGTPLFVRRQGTQSAYLDVTYPINTLASHAEITRRVRLLGYVRLGLNVQQSLEALSSSADLVSGIAILVAIITVPLGFLIVRRVVEPLNELSGITHRFAAGDLSVRSRVRRRDEIGKLTAAFNHMADLHEHNHRELLRLNAELEERVNRRTRQLRELAVRDPLTGLYNRRHFGDVLERRFAEARRYDTPLSCLMLDLDDFKRINDTHGHQVGDELLVLTAKTIAAELRTADVAARVGGDEFMVLLPQTPETRACVLGERVLERLTRELTRHLPEVTLTLSIGAGSLEHHKIDNAEDLLRAADQALYAAKADGKNRVAASAAG